MTTFAMTGMTTLDIPTEPDFARMRREVSVRLRDAMREQGVDALILLGNGNVVYTTGASWPLLDAGLRRRGHAVVSPRNFWMLVLTILTASSGPTASTTVARDLSE